MDGRREALLIANDEYEDAGLDRLVSPAEDVTQLARVLADPAVGDFSVQVLRNEPSHDIQARLEDFFADRRTTDTLLVHFSGHGLKSESGEFFLAARNSRPNRLGSTSIPADFLKRCMRVCRARTIVLFLDCCYGGAFSRGAAVRAGSTADAVEAFSDDRLSSGRGCAIISASSSMEYAFEGTRLADVGQASPSVFTKALVTGLETGEADRNGDGMIGLGELYDYVYDHVREQNPHQTPSCDIGEMQGEFYVARSSHRVLRPAPVPAALQRAVASEDIFSRRGAVTELQARSEDPDLAVAAGALDALRDVAQNDIQVVADGAKRAYRVALPQPVPTRLTFGQVEQSATPPHQRVLLGGPPIARECEIETAPPWLTVVAAPNGGGEVDVALDTSAVGRFSGQIGLKGYAGSANVQVDAEVVAAPERAAARLKRRAGGAPAATAKRAKPAKATKPAKKVAAEVAKPVPQWQLPVAESEPSARAEREVVRPAPLPDAAQPVPEAALPRSPLTAKALLLSVIAVLASWIVLGAVPAVVALWLARRAEAEVAVSAGRYGRRSIRTARILAWSAIAVAGVVLVILGFTGSGSSGGGK